MHETIQNTAYIPDNGKPAKYPPDQPIDGREMTMFEDANMRLTGLSEEAARAMTPQDLADFADAVADSTHCHTLLGC